MRLVLDKHGLAVRSFVASYSIVIVVRITSRIRDSRWPPSRWFYKGVEFWSRVDSVTIFHYTTLATLLAMLQKRAVFFTRLSTLRDPFESIYAEGGFGAVANHRKRRGFVHCWTLSEGESELFWLAYARAGVAIESTTDLLEQSIIGGAKAEFRRVSYKAGAGQWDRKTPSYKWEREFRAHLPDQMTHENSLRIHVDLKVLMRCVHVSPHAPHWLCSVVQELIRKFDRDLPVKSRQQPRDPPVTPKLFLSPRCRQHLDRRAKTQGCSLDEVVTDTLEEYFLGSV